MQQASRGRPVDVARAQETPPSTTPPAPPSQPPPELPPLPPPVQPAARFVPYAGLLRRGLAWVIDYIVLNLIVALVFLVISVVVALTINQQLDPSRSTSQFTFLAVIAMLVSLAYYTFFWSFEGGGQTFGNRALTIKVLRTNGELASPQRALVRAAIMYLSFYLLMSGVLASLVTILVTERKQALHDLLCDTVMVRSPD